MSLQKISQSAFFSHFRTYAISLGFILLVFIPVSYTHLTLPTIYSV